MPGCRKIPAGLFACSSLILSIDNPCISCGACCAYFRATFHWAETDPFVGGRVPAEMTVQVTPHRVAMIGTDRKPPRCIALDGEIGQSVKCNIYEVRADVCRDFLASWENGVHNPRCDEARAAHNLPPLQPRTSRPKRRPQRRAA